MKEMYLLQIKLFLSNLRAVIHLPLFPEFVSEVLPLEDAAKAAEEAGSAAPVVSIIVVLILFGMFLDTMAILFILTPVIYPIVIGLGYDPIWFGIIMIMLVEIGLVTPPIGINIFVVAKMVPQVTTWGAFQGVTPFIIADIVQHKALHIIDIMDACAFQLDFQDVKKLAVQPLNQVDYFIIW